MKVIEGFNEFSRKMSADEKKIFAQLIRRGAGAAVVYHVSYEEWYYQLTEYDDDEMKALFDKYKI